MATQARAPSLTWHKYMLHGISLICLHQKINGKINWSNVLEIFNAVFADDIDASGYPDGLSVNELGKLKSQWADRHRLARSSGWNLEHYRCTGEELVQMYEAGEEIIRQEIRLSGIQGSRVAHPGRNPLRWVNFLLDGQLLFPRDPGLGPKVEDETAGVADGKPVEVKDEVDEKLVFDHGDAGTGPPAGPVKHKTVLGPIQHFESTKDTQDPAYYDYRITSLVYSSALLMVHTATVDFNNGRPTVVLDINTPDPFVNPDTNADDQNTILCGGEVRRITFKKQTSNREQLADCILCDPSICPQCNANSQLPYMSSAWIGRQHPTERGALPLVHQEDLWRVPDRPSFFAPGAQSAVARIAPPGPIMNVSFLNGRVYEVLYCNRKVCETCETKAASRVEYRPSLSEVYSRSVFGPLP